MLYSEKVMKYFKHPKNVGEIKNADGVGKTGNPMCGDIMWLYIKVDPKTTRIRDIKFSTMGCAAAIATSSMVTELAKGKTIEKALKISNKDVAGALGGLPLPKYHCSLLAEDALGEAIYDYLSRKKLPISKELAERHKRAQQEIEHVEKIHEEYARAQEKVRKHR
jgi:nitrogen fixation NifU-like protein